MDLGGEAFQIQTLIGVLSKTGVADAWIINCGMVNCFYKFNVDKILFKNYKIFTEHSHLLVSY